MKIPHAAYLQALQVSATVQSPQALSMGYLLDSTFPGGWLGHANRSALLVLTPEVSFGEARTAICRLLRTHLLDQLLILSYGKGALSITPLTDLLKYRIRLQVVTYGTDSYQTPPGVTCLNVRFVTEPRLQLPGRTLLLTSEGRAANWLERLWGRLHPQPSPPLSAYGVLLNPP